MATRWAVIENGGYIGENFRKTNLSSYMEACEWMEAHYDREEIEELHVDVAHWDVTLECWSYDY